MFLPNNPCTLNGLEDVLESARNDAALLRIALVAFHCMRLSSTSLPVSENRAVVALQNALDDGQSRFVEYSLLPDGRLKDHVEREYLVVLSLFATLDGHLSARGVDGHDRFVSLFDFGGRHGTATKGDLDTLRSTI